MTILASDNFTRANNTDLGAAWDVTVGDEATGFQIVSNLAIQETTNDTSESNNSAAWPADQYSSTTYGTAPATGLGAGVGPMCRCAVTSNTYYRLICSLSGYEISRFNSGTFTSLASGGTTHTAADTATLEVRTNGTNCDWVLKKNGAQFASGTDTTPLASGRAGIAYSSTSTASIAAWEGGDFVSVILPRRLKFKTLLERRYKVSFPAELDVNTWYRSLVERLRMVFA